MMWGGKLYETTASITAADVLDFLTFDLSAFYALYNAVAPDRSQPPSTPAKTYTCSAPCKGGTLQTNHIYVDPRYIKTKAIYVYGTHDLTIRGETHSMTSEAMHKIQVRSASNFVQWIAGIALELLLDVKRDLKDRIIEWLRPLLLELW